MHFYFMLPKECLRDGKKVFNNRPYIKIMSGTKKAPYEYKALKTGQVKYVIENLSSDSYSIGLEIDDEEIKRIFGITSV